MDAQRAFEHAEKSSNYLIETLRRLIAIDTRVPPGNGYERMADFLEPEFRRWGLDVERVVIPPEKVKLIPLPLEGPRINVVATKSAGKEPVSIYAHMDTVHADRDWTLDPFEGTVRDGTLYGLGALDMKGSIACLLAALKTMHELKLEPCFDIHCLMCTDEELGVYPGVYHLALEGYIKGPVFNLELGAQEPVLIQGFSGTVDFMITVHGKSCHSGMNYLGVNAIEELLPIAEELMALKHEVQKRESAIPSFPLPGTPSEKLTPRFTLSIVKGGVKANVVPGECTLTINRRYIPEELLEDVVAEVERAVERGRKRSNAVAISVQNRMDYPPVTFDLESPYMEKLKKARRAVHGYEDFIVGGLSGSTDMGFVAEALGTRLFIGTSPARADNLSAHAADEHVGVADLISMTKELVHFLAF
jgi:succinyl-diaminopimelate desuccinylase